MGLIELLVEIPVLVLESVFSDAFTEEEQTEDDETRTDTRPSDE